MKNLCIILVLAMLILSTNNYPVQTVNQLQKAKLLSAGDDDPVEPLPKPIPPDRTPGNDSETPKS